MDVKLLNLQRAAEVQRSQSHQRPEDHYSCAASQVKYSRLQNGREEDGTIIESLVLELQRLINSLVSQVIYKEEKQGLQFYDSGVLNVNIF